MRNTLKISLIATLCVFGAAGTDALAVGSVRALGGSGTFNGTTAAATRGTNAARAGSLRVSPSATRTVSAGTRTNANGTTTPTERLAIGKAVGKYLGGTTSVSTTGGSSSGGSSSGGSSSSGAEPEGATNDHAQFRADINTLFSNVQTIDGEITAINTALSGKQDTLSAGDYIDIDDNEVSLDLTSLETYLESNLPFAGQGVNVQYDGSRWLKYSTDNGETWTQFLDLNSLSGDYVDETELNNAISTALDTYYTKSEVNTAIQNAIDGITFPEQVQANWNATSGPSEILNKPDLSQYATTSAMNTALADKQDTISDIATIRSGAAAGATAVQPATLENYATTASLSDYATTAELADYATTSAMNTALADKQDTISDIATIRSGAAAGATAVQPATLSSYPTTEQMNAAIAAAELDGEVDLSAYSTTEQINALLADKQDTISDIATIRSGAAAGATAVQPATLENYATTASLSDYATTAELADYATTSAMNTALADKQDTISDIATIRSGAAAGATAVQPATLNDYATIIAMNTALADKQDTISDIATIRSGATAGATAVQPATLSNYATTSAMNTALESYETAAHAAETYQPKGVYVANPTLPTASGDYMLMVKSNGGAYTYSWENAAEYNGSGSGSGGGGSGSGGFSWDDDGW